MKTIACFFFGSLVLLHAETPPRPGQIVQLRDVVPVEARSVTQIGNPDIDYDAFQKASVEARELRRSRGVDEETFLKMAAEPGTLVLDLRSTDKFQAMHVKGAAHLAYTDITEDALKKVIPEKTTRVLIYCNNNFDGEPRLFAGKTVALNIPSFITLYAHGYRNVYELGPKLDVKTTKIPFEGTDVKR